MSAMRANLKRLSHGAHARAGGLASVIRENPLLAVVGGIGFSVSFQTVAHLAHAHHMPGPAILYPIGIDVGILALITEGLHLISENRSDFVPRMLAWFLTGWTIWINMNGSPARDWVGRGMHAVMPALWVICLELVRHRRVGAVRSDSIPFGRWIAGPFSALALWLRMRRDDIKSYRLALELERARLYARDLIRAADPAYRPKRSSLLRKRIREGNLPDEVHKAVSGAVTSEWAPGYEQAVLDWVTAAMGLSARLAASLENGRRETVQGMLRDDPPATSGLVSQVSVEQTAKPAPVMPEPIPEPRPQARPKRPAKPALKLSASKSRSMTPEQLAPHVEAMIAEYGSASINRVKKDLSVGTEKAQQALEIATREAEVLTMPQTAAK